MQLRSYGLAAGPVPPSSGLPQAASPPLGPSAKPRSGGESGFLRLSCDAKLRHESLQPSRAVLGYEQPRPHSFLCCSIAYVAPFRLSAARHHWLNGQNYSAVASHASWHRANPHAHGHHRREPGRRKSRRVARLASNPIAHRVAGAISRHKAASRRPIRNSRSPGRVRHGQGGSSRQNCLQMHLEAPERA